MAPHPELQAGLCADSSHARQALQSSCVACCCGSKWLLALQSVSGAAVWSATSQNEDRLCVWLPPKHDMLCVWLQWEQRPGETIYKGHRSYDLMLNLQLGIRWSVGKITPELVGATLREDAFTQKVTGMDGVKAQYRI